MKKIFPLLLCLLVLFQTTVFAEIGKTISENDIILESQFRYKIEGTDKSIWMYFNRIGYFSRILGSIKTQTSQTLLISTYLDDKAMSPKEIKTDISFSTKNPPHFIFYNNGIDAGQPFKITEFGTDHITFSIADKKALLDANKAFFIVTLRDGTAQRIEIPDDTLKDWKYILTADLWEEYKKGI